MYTVTVKGKKYFVDVNDTDAAIRRVESAAEDDLDIDDLPDFDDEQDAAAGSAAVCAVLPCTITKVLVREGDKVNANDVVMVCEAMKMEMEIRTSAAGTVARVMAKAGDHVEKGQKLAMIEA